MKTAPESALRVACLQMEPRVGEKERNLARSLEMIERAAQAGAKLAVLPELCNTGYVFETRDEAFALSEDVPNGPTAAAWMKAAAKHGMVIVAGITEREGYNLYNGAVIVGPKGYIGKYRKNHLWGARICSSSRATSACRCSGSERDVSLARSAMTS